MTWLTRLLHGRTTTMTTPPPVKGCDYAFDHPLISALKPAGMQFAGRYTSPNPANNTNGKNLTGLELKALLAAGLHVALFFESTAGRMLAGHDAGKADAQTADTAVHALGMTGLPVYFAADWDV